AETAEGQVPRRGRAEAEGRPQGARQPALQDLRPEAPALSARPAHPSAGHHSKSSSPSPPSTCGAPKAISSIPSGPASKARLVEPATRIASHWLTSRYSSSSLTRPLPEATT